MNATTCWHCGSKAEESLFCRFCNSLQPPTPDYYEFFGLERRLSIDRTELQKRFYALSRQLHPDRFARAAPRDRQHSLEATAILNDAYRVLRDPVARAEYVLKEQAPQAQAKAAPPELLEEVFELNEALEELRAGDSSVRPQLAEARRKFIAMRAEADDELEALFRQYDGAPSSSTLAAIRNLLGRRRYIQNLVEQVEKELSV